MVRHVRYLVVAALLSLHSMLSGFAQQSAPPQELKRLYAFVDARDKNAVRVYYREVQFKEGADPDSKVEAPNCAGGCSDDGDVGASLKKLRPDDRENNPWKRGDTRFISQRGDSVAVWVYYKGTTPKISIEERTRSTQLSADLGLLGGIIVTQRDANKTWSVKASHVLDEVRADLSFTVTFETEMTRSTEGTSGVSTQNSEPITIKRSITTGPPEHLYMSVDLPISSADTLKYNSTTNALELEDEPSEFYIGLNFSIGDLFRVHGGKTWYRDLSIKTFMLFDSHPLDSYGFGLGYRGQIFPRSAIRFDAFSPFVGWTFTKEDELAAAQAGRSGTGRNSEFRFGVSANLDTLLGRLTKDKGKN